MKGLVENLCINALENYYRNGTTDFVDAFEENITFFAPNNNRMIVGKENVLKYFTEGGKKLKLSVDNLSTRLIPMKADALIIIADYNLLAGYPDGRLVVIKQHTLVALHKRKSPDGSFRWKCPLIHISNSRENASSSFSSGASVRQYEQDVIRTVLSDRKTVRKIMLSGEGNSTHYIPEDSILYIEGGKGVQCYVHTDSETITINSLLKDVMKKLPSYYYRCHASFIINLRRVKKAAGYKVILSNGEEIPIPAKKYAKVKSDIALYMEQGKS